MRYATDGKHPWWTTTWERAEKRRQSGFDADWKNFGSHSDIARFERKNQQNSEKIFTAIADRVRKQHPGMKKIKARLYARHSDLQGRKFQRLKDQGLGAEQIAKRLGYDMKTGQFKASSGHSGGIAIYYG